MTVEVGRRRDVGGEVLEERFEVRPGGVRVERRPTGPSGAVHDREVDLMVLGVEVEEELVDLVHHGVDPGVGAVDLVHHQDDREVAGECLSEHESGLGKGPFSRVDEEHHAVNHGEGSLHLTAEVGVAWGVDHVDRDSRPHHGGVLGEDRDPLLPFEVTRVHHPFGNLFMVAERAGLAEHRVDEGGLAVVDVGDDRHVAQVGPLSGGRRARFGVHRVGPTRC